MSADHALFLWINLAPDAPAWAFMLARWASHEWMLVLLVATVTTALVGRPAWRHAAWRALLAALLASCAAYAIKRGLGFPRPFALGLGHVWVPHGASAEFPSSHASAATALVLTIAITLSRSTLVWLLALMPALLVAWSRVALGLHFPSDAIAALCLGAVCALVVRRLRWPVLALRVVRHPAWRWPGAAPGAARTAAPKK